MSETYTVGKKDAVDQNASDISTIKGIGWTDETVKDNADEIASVKGTGWTDENLVDHEGRLDTLEGVDTVEGSVLKSIKDNAENATFTPDTSGLDSTDLGSAIKEIYAEKKQANGIATLDANSKIPSSQLPVTAMEYKGSWDASTGSYPATQDTGDYWVVGVGGTVGGEVYDAGDAIIYNGTTWDKIPRADLASLISYDNTSSGLTAVNVQDALDEISANALAYSIALG